MRKGTIPKRTQAEPKQRSIVERMAFDAPKVAAIPTVEATAGHDDLDVLMAVRRHFVFDYSLGAAFERLVEARTLTGAERKAKLILVKRYVDEEIAAIERGVPR